MTHSRTGQVWIGNIKELFYYIFMSQEITDIKSRIYTVRGKEVMLDSDLAKLYDVLTRNLNKAVKRNIKRFPKEFMFQLTKDEFSNLEFHFGISSNDSLRFQNGTLKKGRGKHRKYLPFVFTEQGVAMLSSVLRSKTAIKVSIQIIDAFIAMRRFLLNNAQVFQRLDRVELKQIEHDKKFEHIFNAIENKSIKPSKGIFFEGQIFDAYKFVSSLIRNAKKEIILIDNYIDESTLILFSKSNAKITIYTKLTDKSRLDIEKYKHQYNNVKIKEFNKSHDRFLIIDKVIYHVGASLKDLGKKWFAFSKFENDLGILRKLEGLL